jgi:hypothetical protein
MLESNAQRVPGLGLFGAQGLAVKFPGAFEPFERQALSSETPNGYEAGTLAQSALEPFPGFLVEFGSRAKSVLAQLSLVGFERTLQMCADRVGWGSEFYYPLFHDLGIAKRAKAAEEFARDLTHGGPSGIGVDFFHDGSNGAAPPNGYTKIMDSVRAGSGADILQLLNDAVHPKGKAAVLRAGTGGKSNYARHN